MTLRDDAINEGLAQQRTADMDELRRCCEAVIDTIAEQVQVYASQAWRRAEAPGIDDEHLRLRVGRALALSELADELRSTSQDRLAGEADSASGRPSPEQES